MKFNFTNTFHAFPYKTLMVLFFCSSSFSSLISWLAILSALGVTGPQSKSPQTPGGRSQVETSCLIKVWLNRTLCNVGQHRPTTNDTHGHPYLWMGQYVLNTGVAILGLQYWGCGITSLGHPPLQPSDLVSFSLAKNMGPRRTIASILPKHPGGNWKELPFANDWSVDNRGWWPWMPSR